MLPYHKHRRIPYLYSSADVAALMTEARPHNTHAAAGGHLRNPNWHVGVTGMRIGEAIREARSADERCARWPRRSRDWTRAQVCGSSQTERVRARRMWATSARS